MKFSHPDQFAEIVFRLTFIALGIGFLLVTVLPLLIMVILYYQTGHLNDSLFDLVNSIK